MPSYKSKKLCSEFPGGAQQVKDPASQQQLSHMFDPWPKNFHKPLASPKKEKRKKEEEVMGNTFIYKEYSIFL